MDAYFAGCQAGKRYKGEAKPSINGRGRPSRKSVLGALKKHGHRDDMILLYSIELYLNVKLTHPNSQMSIPGCYFLFDSEENAEKFIKDA